MSHFLHTLATFLPCDREKLSRDLRKIRRPLIFLFTVSCLTSVVGYRFYNQPKLSVGTISPITITAPTTASFTDKDTTEAERQKTRAGLIPVLKRDPQMTDQIERSIFVTLEQLDSLRQILPKYPLILARPLSESTLHYLLTCPESEWSELLATVTSSEYFPKDLTETQRYALEELQNYGTRIPTATWQKFLAQLSQLRQEYGRIVPSSPYSFLNKISYSLLFKAVQESDQNWRDSKQGIFQVSHLILTQGIPSGISNGHLREAIELQISDRVPLSNQPLAQELLFAALENKPNLTEDRIATQLQAIKAIESVETVMADAQEGQIIVKAGEKITRANFVLLDGFGLSERGINWYGLGMTGIIVTGAIGTFCLVARRLHRPLRHRDFLLLSLMSFTPPLLAILNIPFTCLPFVGLLAGSFYGPTLAVTQVLLTSGLSVFSINALSWDLIAGTVGGLLAALIAGRLRSRDELSLLGGGVALVQGGVYLLSYLIVSATAGTIVYTLLPHAIIYGLSGLAWTVVALGISPYLERFFDVVTPIRLVELSNPNCALLKRLATETPGTFQHTLFVACLAEAAARKLHCNVELIRAGTLYHDIGKMHDPLGFIENQMGSPNKHDAINDPYISAEIIKKHVSEGLVMARKYGLPRVIRDFIPEHQGTLLISYFYHQAKQKSDNNGKEPIFEGDFRYDGPIPQSRETGIVMLADSSEAALRSLKEATPEQAMDMIKKIFQARWREHQLVDSGIRQEELPIIAEVFVQVWMQFHHQRIAYPKAVLDTPAIEQKNA